MSGPSLASGLGLAAPLGPEDFEPALEFFISILARRAKVLYCLFARRRCPTRSETQFSPLCSQPEPILPRGVATTTAAEPNREGAVSTSQAVAQHLPYLRRYARALTGSQSSGDAYVAATLEALIEDPSVLETASGPRVGLYRLFTKIWNSVGVNGAIEPAEQGLPVEQRLAHITPRARQAFLLIALEGFSEDDAAQILDTDVATLRALVEESGRELAAEIATDVLIIEDETFIAMDLETLVESLGHRVMGIARTHNEALAIAREKKPGLILADIQLADGSSGL